MDKSLVAAASVLVVLGIAAVFAFQYRGAEVSAAADRTSDRPASETAAPDSTLATATFAGGCFWCMEPPFEELDGVQSTISGFSGGHVEDPTYAEVSSGGTGHAEVVQVVYDSTVVSYEELLDVYWHNVDPTQRNGQFCDIGSQYRSAIYYHNPHQRRLAESSKAELVSGGRFAQVVTDIEPFTGFYRADASHQDFYLNRPARYQQYLQACGRKERLREIWGDEATSS